MKTQKKQKAIKVTEITPAEYIYARDLAARGLSKSLAYVCSNDLKLRDAHVKKNWAAATDLAERCLEVFMRENFITISGKPYCPMPGHLFSSSGYCTFCKVYSEDMDHSNMGKR